MEERQEGNSPTQVVPQVTGAVVMPLTPMPEASQAGGMPHEDEEQPIGGKSFSAIALILLVLYELVFSLAALVGLIRFWPQHLPMLDTTENVTLWGVSIGNATQVVFIPVSPEIRLFLLVAFGGVLGAQVHAFRSLANFAGNRDLKSSWAVWYVLKPVVGAMLGVVAYLAVRGVANPQVPAAQMSPYNYVALSALAGMFTVQVTEKLKKVFDVLFAIPPENKDKTRSSQGGPHPESPQPVSGNPAPAPPGGPPPPGDPKLVS